MKLLIVNGPNLNLLGEREAAMYGTIPFHVYLEQLKQKYTSVTIDYKQSNHEGELIEVLHQAHGNYHGIILNPGAYTHTSIAICDAIKAINVPVVEVHISQIMAREPFRKQSFISPVCKGCIFGFGLDSYRLAIESFIQ